MNAKQKYLKLTPAVANPIKLFFFANKESLRFLLLSKVILLSIFFLICNRTLKLNSKNRKTKKKKFYRIGYKEQMSA